MSSPFPLMFHPTLIVEDLEATAQWFRRVFGRCEVRWEEKWDLAKLNPSYPINYSYFFFIGDVALDVLCPALLKLPGGRTAVYPRGEGLADIAWYTSDIQDVAKRLSYSGFRVRDQEGAIIVNGNVPTSSLIDDCYMIWTITEDSGLTYEFFQMDEQHFELYSSKADPRLSKSWISGAVAEDDPLSIISSAHHTVMTANRNRALRLYTDVLGGQHLHDEYSARLDADCTYIAYADSVLEFATPRAAQITDTFTGEPTNRDQYRGITFTVADIDKAESHLRTQNVLFTRHEDTIITRPHASKGAEWCFQPRASD